MEVWDTEGRGFEGKRRGVLALPHLETHSVRAPSGSTSGKRQLMPSLPQASARTCTAEVGKHSVTVTNRVGPAPNYVRDGKPHGLQDGDQSQRTM
jgi:hypothetical protein